MLQVRAKPVHAVALGLLIRREVGLLLLGHAEVGRVLVVLAFRHRRHVQFVRVVHRVPRLGHQIGRMGIEETGPHEKRPVGGSAFFELRIRALGDPGVVMILLGNRPLVQLLLVLRARRLVEIVAPVLATLLLHPDHVMLPHMRLVGVVARELHVIEPIERPVELAPVVQVLHDRHRFERRVFVGAEERLKMRLADEGRVVTGGGEVLAHRMLALEQLRPERVGAMLTRVLARDDRCAGGRAGRVARVGAVKGDAALGQPVQIRRLDLRVHEPQRHVMLLIAGDEQYVRRLLVGHGRKRLLGREWRGMDVIMMDGKSRNGKDFRARRGFAHAPLGRQTRGFVVRS